MAGCARRFGRGAARAAASYVRSLYGRFALVLAPSRLVAGRLRSAGINDVVVQPLGVDARTFSPHRRAQNLRQLLGLPDNSRLLAFAGRFAPEKNLAELFEAVELLGHPYHLLVIGGEQRRRVGRRITMLPYERDPGRVAALLGGCDALVHAGRQETFGLVALEAMACGLPVVAYEGGALAELLDVHVGRLARPLGPGALAEAVAWLFACDHRSIGANARRRVLDRYTWDAILSAQLRHVARLLDRATLIPADPLLRTA